MERTLTWSYGGGTQSVAIAVLIAQGRLPKPECIVIADTGREATETWEYTDAHVRPLLAGVGLQIEVAPHSLATVDLYGHNDDLLVPAFTGAGKLHTFCSTEWKQRVVRRYLVSLGYGPKAPVTTWVGMSVDEIGRLKPSGVDWQEYVWPLAVDLRYTRPDCVRVVEQAGLPKPPKSSCWMCPHRQNSQWANLKMHYPQDWQRAVELDKEIRAKDEQHNVYLHRSGKPLEQADLTVPDKPPLPMFGDIDDCDSGFCMV